MGAKEKKTELNVLNIILCLLVILIHSMGSAIWQTVASARSYPVFTALFRLSSFAVQGFIFLSAVKLYMNKSSASYGKFIWRRVKTVFLPYLLYVPIYYIYKLSVEKRPFDILYLIKSIFSGNMHAHFYFVILIMQFYFLFPLFKKLYEKGSAESLTAVSVAFSLAFQFSVPHALKFLFNIDFTFADRTFLTYLGYWTLGAYAGMNYDKFKSSVCKTKYAVFICFLLFGAIICPENYRVMRFSEFVPGFGELFFAYTFPAILFFFIISVMLSKLMFFNSGFFVQLNRVSYRVYLIHPFILALFDRFTYEFVWNSPALYNILRYFSVTVLSFGISFLIEKAKDGFLFITKKLTA